MCDTKYEKTGGQPDPDTLRECEATFATSGMTEIESHGTSPTREAQDELAQEAQPARNPFLDHVKDSIRKTLSWAGYLPSEQRADESYGLVVQDAKAAKTAATLHPFVAPQSALEYP